MKLRRLLMAMRLWVRSCRARRENKRLRKALDDYRFEWEEEKRRLMAHYERQLAYERTRCETIHVKWADRLLQSQKLATLGLSTSLITESSELKLHPDLRNQIEDTLTSNQLMELQDRKDQFFRDGLALEKSPAEISHRWEDIKDDVVSDIKLAII